MTVDNTKGTKSGPKFTICVPDKALLGSPDAGRNSIRVFMGYTNTWLPEGVYDISIPPAGLMGGNEPAAKRQQSYINMGGREIVAGDRKLYYRLRTYGLKFLPPEAQKLAVGVGVFEARGPNDVSIDAAVAKPSNYEKDPIGSMDALMSKGVGALLEHITIAE